MKKGMIKVSVLYPNEEGKPFNLDYYTSKHIPMVGRLVGEALKSASVEKGLGGVVPGSSPDFTVMAHMYFDSLESFQNSFGPKAEEIMADLPNFTEIQPKIIISEVLV